MECGVNEVLPAVLGTRPPPVMAAMTGFGVRVSCGALVLAWGTLGPSHKGEPEEKEEGS